jgi:ABC-2 type transport system permease protein
MNWNRIRAVVYKDLQEVLSNSKALLPAIIVPAIFVVVFPSIVIGLSSFGNVLGMFQGNTTEFLNRFPASLVPRGFTMEQKMVYAMILYFFAPFFLIIPTMISSVISANCFVGEKEAKTIEGLLYTPITDRELVFAKVLVSFLPSVAVSWIAFIAYAIIANGLAFPLFGRLWFPNVSWILMMIVLVPALAFFSISLIVYISQKSKDVWEAQQISALILVPIIVLVLVQVAGVIYLDPLIILVTAFVFTVIDFISFRFMVKRFDRERIVTRLT